MTPENLQAMAREAAVIQELDPALVCAVIEQESGWNTWAVRFEPEFERRYIHPALPSAPTTEELSRAISWGLMQVMGQTAREFGFKSPYLSAMCDPQIGIEVGCTVLSAKLKHAKGDTQKALLLWNGGTNKAYPIQVVARMNKYSAR